jgi:Bacteriophage Sf6, terminase small subunit-like
LFIATMQTKDPPKSGRSPGYSARIAETICDRLVNRESLRAICADPAMPARATIFRWLARHQEFRRQHALARECLEQDLMYEILRIADDSSGDYVKKTGADGKLTRVVDREHIEECRRRIKARRRILAYLAPKKYRYR